MGMTNPTPIQQYTLLPGLQGRDVIGAAPTGSGKTLCFAVPILQSLASDPYGVHSLVLTPTRELAFQIGDQFRALGSKISIRVQIVVGGLDMLNQTTKLLQIPHVIVATPGRLSHILRDNTCPGFTLKRIKFLVLDEADLLLSKNFQETFSEIMKELPKKRQTMLFSATMTPNLKRLSSVALSNPYFHDTSPKSLYELPEGLKQEYCLVSPTVKDCYLFYLIKRFSELPSIMVFVSSRRDCETIYIMLKELQIKVTQLHSIMHQDKRNQSIQSFKSGNTKVLVATDVASRGLDIPAVGLVINYNIPQTSENYVHRVGRTARAGRGGTAISLITQYDVESVLTIEENTKSKMTLLEHDEEEVLLLLNKAITAKQVAILYLDDSGFYEKLGRFEEHKKNQKDPNFQSVSTPKKRKREGEEKEKKKKK